METLSQSQQEIVDLASHGAITVSEIAQKLGKSEGIVRAQLTRIRNAGHKRKLSNVNDDFCAASDRPRSSSTSSNQNIVNEAEAAGTAQYEIPEELAKQFEDQFGGKTDIHPMVLLGVTIQYVKFVGGRLTAHRMIEQVYEALRAMVGDGSPKVGEEQWSAPWPLNAVEAENAELRNRISAIEKSLKAKK